MSFDKIPSAIPQTCFTISNPKIHKMIEDSGVNNLAKLMNTIATTLTFTDGRDKSMKVIQYSLSVLMITLLRKYKLLTQHHERINGIMKMFGDARKVVRLMNFSSFLAKLIFLLQGKGFNPITPMHVVEKRNYGLVLVKTISEFCNCITDDIFCLSRFKVLNTKFGDDCKRWSIKLWWTSLSIDLYLHGLKYLNAKKLIKLNEKEGEETAKLENELSTIKVNFIKIISDMIFCGYDLFYIKKHIEFMHAAGIVSGYIGYSRLFKKTWNNAKF